MVLACLVSGGWFLRKTGLVEERGILGGPSSALLSSAQGAELENPGVLDANDQIALADQSGLSGDYISILPAAAVSVSDAALKDLGAPVGPAFDRSGTIVYSVQRGDTLSQIASYFGISVDTVISANPGVRAGALKTGQNLKILPTTGVTYETRGGDTLESISNLFGVSQGQVMQFNRSVNFSLLDPGTSIIIPGGKNMARLATGGAALPNFNDNFIMPASGYNWGILHHYNAVDIANSCDTPVVASAEGLVVPDEDIPYVQDGWNEGYGNFVLIEHPFGSGVRTRYAHLEKVSVQIGDYVKQGQVIGLMGETGDATGCHVHFEVYGAQNPFAKH